MFLDEYIVQNRSSFPPALLTLFPQTGGGRLAFADAEADILAFFDKIAKLELKDSVSQAILVWLV